MTPQSVDLVGCSASNFADSAQGWAPGGARRRVSPPYTTLGNNSIEEGLLQEPNIRMRGFWWFWWFCLVTSPLVCGVLALWSEQPWLLHYFIPAAYAALLYSLLESFYTCRDPFNPLGLVLAIGFVRFFLPGILVLSGAELPDEVRHFFHLMQLSDSDLQWGHALALVGILAVALGWLLIQAQWTLEKPLKFHLTDGVLYASLVGMLVGFMALCAFFLTNSSPGALTSGTFRGTIIQEGTGKYFLMAYLLIAGSVLLCCYLLSKGFKWLALVPVGVSMLSYWPLGGRGRAMVSVAGGLILLWYWGRERRRWEKLSVKSLLFLRVPVGVLCIILVFYVGALYRGNSDGQVLSDRLSFVELWPYLKRSIYTDLGQLYGLAGAIVVGPAVLGEQNFIGVLLWPLSTFMSFPGKSAGVYIVETLTGFADDRKWAVSSSLIGDAYLSLGLWGVVAVMTLYGALCKILYVKFRQGVMHSVIYTLATLYSLQIFMGAINVWPHALTVLSFAFVLMLLGRTFFNVEHKGGLPELSLFDRGDLK